MTLPIKYRHRYILYLIFVVIWSVTIFLLINSRPNPVTVSDTNPGSQQNQQENPTTQDNSPSSPQQATDGSSNQAERGMTTTQPSLYISRPHVSYSSGLLSVFATITPASFTGKCRIQVVANTTQINQFETDSKTEGSQTVCRLEPAQQALPINESVYITVSIRSRDNVATATSELKN